MAQNFTTVALEAEQKRVSDIVNAQRCRLPEGACRLDLKFDEDWAGDPAVHITLVVGKDVETAPSKVTEFGAFLRLLREEIIGTHTTYWPFTRISVEK